VTTSWIPTPREIPFGMPWTISKKSRMPDGGMSRTWLAMNPCLLEAETILKVAMADID